MSVSTVAILIVSVIAVGAVPAVAEGTAQEANFEVEITEAPDVVAGGDTVVVKATITNTGNASDSQEIHLKNPNHDIVDSVDSPAVSLDPGESETVTLRWETTQESPSGNISVQSDDDVDDHYVEIRDGPSFEFSSTLTNDGDDRVNVSLTVKNTGDMAGTTSAWMEVAGDTKDSQQLTLQPNESTQVELVWNTESTSAGEWGVTVGVGDSSVSYSVEISDDDSEDSSNNLLVEERSNALVEGTTASVSGHDVTQVQFAEPVDGQITVDKLRRLPEGPEPVEEDVGLYRITVPESASGTAGTVTLTIEDARLDGEAPETVLVKRWNGSAWVSLETQVSVEGGTVTITAPMQNFTVFAVTTSAELTTPTDAATATETPTPTATETESETTQAAATETPTEDETMQTETATPGFGVVAALIAMVLAALVLTKARRD